MTKHERHLAEYPWRIARKRLNRRRMAKKIRIGRKVDQEMLRRVLADYKEKHPEAFEPVRAGKPTIATRVKNFFRKPTI